MSQMFPILVHGSIQRVIPPGRPDIEAQLHPMMAQGMFLERSLGDGLFYLQDRKQQIQEYINAHLNLNLLATDGQFPDSTRPAKYVVDSVKFLKIVQDYTQQSINVINAISQTVQQYTNLKNEIQQYFQERSNALATLLNEICNFNLPTIPSIPLFFANFTFDGFNFPLNSFDFKVTFDKDFAFGACKFRSTNLPIFSQYPKSINIGGQVAVTIPQYQPPFTGSQYYTGVEPVTEITNIPYFTTFDPNTDFYTGGVFPKPDNIVSNYHIPLGYYTSQVSSVIGFSPSISSYYNNNQDPNIMAGLIIRLHNSRTARGGTYLSSFQQAFDLFVKPSYDYLSANGIVWNNVLGGSGIKAGDPNLPIISLLQQQNAVQTGQILWMLSWLETSLLGYTRNKDYDIYQDETGSQYDSLVKSYLNGITGQDLDYIKAVDDGVYDIIVTLDSNGSAQYPSIIYVSKGIKDKLDTIIQNAITMIEQVDTYQSVRPQNRAIYNEFGNIVIIDKYSQFWKDFSFNYNTLIKSTENSRNYILNYSSVLEEYLNPLVTDKTLLDTLTLDANTRDTTWLPGLPYLPQYTLPLTQVLQNPTTGTTNGWSGDTFNPDDYLLRSDIKGLTLNQKLQMIEINKAYASLRASTQDMVASIDNAISSANSSIGSNATTGFKYDTQNPIIDIPTNGIVPSFPVKLFDYTGYYQDGMEFLIKDTGSFSITATINWGTDPEIGYRSVSVIKNDAYVIATKQSDLVAGPVTVTASTTTDLVAGDRIKVSVFHNLPLNQTIDSGEFSAILLGATGTASSAPPSTTSSPNTISVTTPVAITAGTCLHLNANNTVTVLDPTNAGVTPFIDAIALAGANANATIDVANIHGQVYNIPTLNLTPGPIFLSLTGNLTQTAPSLAGGYHWYVQVGRAVNATTIILDSQLPIFLG